MHEQVLADFFSEKTTATELANDVEGATTRLSARALRTNIVDLTETFTVTRDMLVRLCDAVLSGYLKVEHLETIGFTLQASERFEWVDDDLIAGVTSDWACPEINYPLTLENVQKWKNALLGAQEYPWQP